MLSVGGAPEGLIFPGHGNLKVPKKVFVFGKLVGGLP